MITIMEGQEERAPMGPTAGPLRLSAVPTALLIMLHAPPILKPGSIYVYQVTSTGTIMCHDLIANSLIRIHAVDYVAQCCTLPRATGLIWRV